MKGSYLLLIYLSEECLISIGRLGEVYFTVGWYTYVGSAMKGFQSRLPHHLRKNKKLHWHIDYLLQKASIQQIITIESEAKTECQIAGKLMKEFVIIPGFGCSDCKCQSHLFYSPSPEKLQVGINSIRSYYLLPKFVWNTHFKLKISPFIS
jgi:sugar fermentation stimulation protein A